MSSHEHGADHRRLKGMQFQFVVLGYTRDIQAAKGIEIGLAAKRIDTQEPAALTLQMAPNWTELVEPEDRIYLEAIFAELMELPAEQSMQILSELSVGYLRTNAEGVCDEKSLPHIVQNHSQSMGI